MFWDNVGLKSKFSWVALLLVLLGSFLRLWQYWEFPIAGETQDEVAWTWLGSSLLKIGQPASWSHFDGYSTYQWFSFGGSDFRIVQPALDHPPLFSLLPGSFHLLSGNDFLTYPSIKQIRFPVVALSIINLVLFAQWLRVHKLEKFGEIGRLAALAVFASAPSFVFLSRLVVSENLLITWILILLLAAERKGKWSRWAQWLTLIALPLTKIAGLAVVVAEVFSQFESRRDWRRPALFAALGVGLLLLYAALFDFGLFWQVQTQQAQRDSGLLTLFSAQMWAPTLVEKLFADIWLTLGLIAGFIWLLSGSALKQKHITYLFLSQLAFILLSVGEHTIHGWYRIPLLPLMAFFIGWSVQQIWQERNWFGLAAGWILAMPILRLGWLAVDIQHLFRWQAGASKAMLGMGGLSAFAVVLADRHQNKLWPVLSMLLVIIVIVSNILTVVLLQDQPYWQDLLYLEQGIRP